VIHIFTSAACEMRKNTRLVLLAPSQATGWRYVTTSCAAGVGKITGEDKIKKRDDAKGERSSPGLGAQVYTYMKCHEMSWIRPVAGSAMVLNAAGEKSRAPYAHAVQRSTRVTVTDFP